MENSLIAKNNKGEIVKFKLDYLIEGVYTFCLGENLTEIVSIPNNVFGLDCSNNQLTSLSDILPQNIERLSCEHNNIKQLPDLRKFDKLTHIWCDICCFEDYMLEMKDTEFIFY